MGLSFAEWKPSVLHCNALCQHTLRSPDPQPPPTTVFTNHTPIIILQHHQHHLKIGRDRREASGSTSQRSKHRVLPLIDLLCQRIAPTTSPYQPLHTSASASTSNPGPSIDRSFSFSLSLCNSAVCHFSSFSPRILRMPSFMHLSLLLEIGLILP